MYENETTTVVKYTAAAPRRHAIRAATATAPIPARSDGTR